MARPESGSDTGSRVYPTAHAEDCCYPPDYTRCTCGLAYRQRIFDLEQRAKELEAELAAAKDEALVQSELAAVNEAEG